MNLTIKEKVGQLFLVGITKKENLEDVIYLIKEYHIGGVIIYKNNYSNYEEMLALVNKLKDANKNNKLPLFISIDQECGRVNRFPKEFQNIPAAYNIGTLNDSEIKLTGSITAEMLSKTGINMNFAPSLDLKLFNDFHYIGNRAYSNDPDKVYDITKIITEEFEKEGVIPVLKHFPGHGSIKRDSHFFLPRVSNYTKLLNNDTKPFIKAMENNATAIMIGHIVIKGRTKGLPASISKPFIKSIREDYNYEGLIVSDELAMRSVRHFYGRKRSIIKAANAGVDVIMYKYYKDLEAAISTVVKLYELNKIDTTEIDTSYNRVQLYKNKFNFTHEKLINSLDIEKINEKIESIKEQCENNIFN